MKRSLLIKNCQTFSAQKPKSTCSKNIFQIFNVKSGFMVLFMMVAISSLGYLFQINQLATMGQEVNGKEQSLKILKEENKALEIQIAQLKSSYQFEEERERLNLVNPGEVSFIEIERNGEMAMAK